MAWPESTIWWQVYPLGFTGAYPAPRNSESAVHDHRTLAALVPWLDYVIDLGCSGLLLGPIFESRTHGYDTTDYRTIDPRLGTLADFDHLVAECRRRGLRVLLDGVFNHVGADFAPLTQARSGGVGAADAARWFRPAEGPAPPGLPTDFATFEGHAELVLLNHAEPEVATFVANVMAQWLDRGVDGWRLDAAYAVPPGFWAPVLAEVREQHPDAWFVGEMIHGDYSAYAAESTLDSVTQYELWKAIWSSLNDGNLFELAWALKRHETYTRAFVPLTFVGNHDVTRLASGLTNPEHLGPALAVLMTVAGIPSIYYGDEQAFRGTKEHTWGGDDAIRPAFPTEPEGLAPFGWETYRLHQELIALRRRHPWLVTAETAVAELTNTAIALRGTPPVVPGPDARPEEIWTLINIGSAAHAFEQIPADLRVEAGSQAARDLDPAVLPPGAWLVGHRPAS